MSSFVYRYAPMLSVSQLLMRTRALPLSRFPDGQIAKIIGRVKPAVQPMRAPLSGRECVYSRVEVQVRDTQSTGWIPLFEQLAGSVFSIDDGSDTALVEMPRAHVALVTDVDTLSRPRLANRHFVEHLLRERGYPFHWWQPDELLSYYDGYTVRSLRCIESAIALDERIAVCGYGFREVRSDPSRTTNYRSMPTRLVFRAQRRAPLLVSDRPQTLRR